MSGTAQRDMDAHHIDHGSASIDPPEPSARPAGPPEAQGLSGLARGTWPFYVPRARRFHGNICISFTIPHQSNCHHRHLPHDPQRRLPVDAGRQSRRARQAAFEDIAEREAYGSSQLRFIGPRISDLHWKMIGPTTFRETVKARKREKPNGRLCRRLPGRSASARHPMPIPDRSGDQDSPDPGYRA